MILICHKSSVSVPAKINNITKTEPAECILVHISSFLSTQGMVNITDDSVVDWFLVQAKIYVILELTNQIIAGYFIRKVRVVI